MSRVGRKLLPLPDGVKVMVGKNVVHVEGALGKLSAVMPDGVGIVLDNGVCQVTAPKPTRVNRGYQGMMRAVLANMVFGVTKGYERVIEIQGVGYKAEHKGNVVVFSLGYTHPVTFVVPKTLKVVVDKNQTKVTVIGMDKQEVHQAVALMRSYKEPEPYKGKGVRFLGEKVVRKAGKANTK